MALLMKPEPFSSEINRLFNTLFDDGQAIAGERNRGVVRVGEQDHVVDSQRGEDLRARTIAAHCIAGFSGLARAEIR